MRQRRRRGHHRHADRLSKIARGHLVAQGPHHVALGTDEGDAGRLAGTKTVLTSDLSAAFHKYAVKWEPTRQTFYFDGREIYTLAVSMPDPMYIMLDLWYGSASGQPDSTTPTGSINSYEINYVRAWKQG